MTPEGPTIDDVSARLKEIDVTPTIDACRAYEAGFADAMEQIVEPLRELAPKDFNDE
jgi:hypothetical protein